jgi:uncharacterized membrane protein
MREGIESLGRVRLQGVALLVIAFLIGGLAGAVFERIRGRHEAPRMFDRSFGPLDRPGELPPFFSELGLSEQQETRIREILEKHRPMTDSILQQSMPHLRAVLDSTQSEIRQILSPEQRSQLDRRLPRREPPGQPGPRPPNGGGGNEPPPQPPPGPPR